jgi:glycosyltransferase involved in cell wall biosynthesis
MRIAFLSVSSEIGGSETSLLLLVRNIRRMKPDWQLTVVVPREGPLARRTREADVDARVLALPTSLARLGEAGLSGGGAALARRGAALMAAAGAVGSYKRALAALLADIGADVVHTNGFKLHILGTWAASEDVPVVWHVHEYVSPRPITRTLLKRHASRAAAIVANSRSVAADLTQVFGRGAPVRTVYNAVDLDEFSPDGARVDLDRLSGLAPAPDGTVRVGLMATFGRWKGHEPFLRAMQRVTRAGSVRGYIIGAPLYDTDGSQYTMDEVRNLASELGIADRIGFTGFVERPAPILRSLDVVVHASTQPEPFGLVIAEGMACGRAVIVSRAGGAAEIVDDGVTALTHVPGNVDDLSTAIERCVTNPELRRQLGIRARQAATMTFDPTTFAGAFADVYCQVRPAAAGAR